MTLDDRVPPHDLGAEAVVLSESIEQPDQFALVADKLAPEDFYSESNRWIYRAIGELTAAGVVVDNVAIAGWLRDRERLTQCGGASYLAELVHCVPAGGIEQKAARVLAFSRARKLIATAQRIAAEGYGVAGDYVQQFLDEAERDVFEIAQGVEHARDAAPMSEVMGGSYQNLVRAEARGQGNVELPTGLARLDDKIGGLQRGGLYVVAARPGMGKTSLATGVVEAVANVGALVAVFSLEMPREDLGTRMACCRAGVDLKRAIDGRMTDRERCDFLYAQDWLAKLPIFIDDTPAVSILQIRAKARRIASKAGRPIDCVAIDYLSLMTPEVSDGGREREIASTTAALKRLARELKCPVILLAQLNRLCELREDKRPKLSDLRESGAVEQDADAVIFIYRDDYYHEASERKGIAELIVAKQRNGPTGTVCVAFHAPSTAFRNLHHEEPSNQAA